MRELLVILGFFALVWAVSAGCEDQDGPDFGGGGDDDGDGDDDEDEDGDEDEWDGAAPTSRASRRGCHN